MHELSVCQALLAQVTALVREHHAQGVSRILVGIGPLSGVDPHLIAQAFPIVAAGSEAERAALVLETIPVVIRCPTCGGEHTVAVNRLLCPFCQQPGDLVRGDELLLLQVALDLPP